MNSRGSTVKKLIPGQVELKPIPHPRQSRGPTPSAHSTSSPTLFPSPPLSSLPGSQRSTSPSPQPDTMACGSRTIVKRTKDAALEYVKKALHTNGSLLTKLELGFVRTSCHILGINSEAMIRVIMKKGQRQGAAPAEEGAGLPAVPAGRAGHQSREAPEAHPNPCLQHTDARQHGSPSTQSGAPPELCGRTEGRHGGGYSMGIKTARIATENARSDFKATIDRIAEASRWKEGTIEDWLSRGETICAGLMEKAEEALKKAEARAEAEARLRIMESHCEELAELAEQAGKQIPAEAEAEVLIDLEEEIGQRKEKVGDLGRALKETAPADFKDRVEQAIQDSVAMAQKGRRYIDHVKTRLEFISKDSESGSYKGATGEGVMPGRWQTAAEELGEEDESEDEMDGSYGMSSENFLEIMCGLGHMRANDNGLPTFDGRYASYPRFKKE
jgi:hypothetical protein